MKASDRKTIAQFNAWAAFYDRVFFIPFFLCRRAVLRSAAVDHHFRVLDIGCGTGVLLRELHAGNSAPKPHGIDISPAMLKKARHRLGRSTLLCRTSAENLPYEANRFDLVTCLTSFHHYTNPNRALREMNRVLKPGGKALLLDPFTDGTLRTIACSLVKLVFSEPDISLFTSARIRRMFFEAGFASVSQESCMFYKLLTVGVKP